MKRRDLLKAASVTLVAAGSGNSFAVEENAKKPNILLLMTDQHRGDSIGCDGNDVVITPNYDAVAADGAHFPRGYSSLPSCTPARATLLTGWAAWRHGMLGYSKVCSKYKNEMPRMLAEAGYYTLGIGKMHWHPQRNLHGFHKTLVDESGRVESKDFVSDYRQWFKKVAPGKNPDVTGIGWNDYRAGKYKLDEKLHPTYWTGLQAVEFLKNYKQDKPFFLKVSFARPHSPYDAPERFWKMYEGKKMPEAFVGEWSKENEVKVRKRDYDIARGNLGKQQVQDTRHGYYGNITFIDEQIGKIVAELKRRGMYENTLILICADHGDMVGDHHMWRKTYAYEGSSRVPFIVRWPSSLAVAKRGVKIKELVELRDVLPTFLDAAGVKINRKDFDGWTILDLIKGKKDKWRKYLDLEHSRCYWAKNQWTCMIGSRFKYIYFAYDGSEQLFDLENDPGETKDISKSPKFAADLKRLNQAMVDYLTPRGERWVKDGKLQKRKRNMTHSPNYKR